MAGSRCWGSAEAHTRAHSPGALARPLCSGRLLVPSALPEGAPGWGWRKLRCPLGASTVSSASDASPGSYFPSDGGAQSPFQALKFYYSDGMTF